MNDTKRQPKQFKLDSVSDLKTRLTSAKTAVFVNYAGLGVKPQQDLKKQLKEIGSTMLVAKNTMLKLAASEAKYPSEAFSDSVLTGQTALVLSGEDAVAPIQILGKFIETNEYLKLKGGVVEGRFQDETSLKKLSKLPSKEVLYAQVVGGMSAPMYGLVGTLQGNLQKLLWILKAKAQSV